MMEDQVHSISRGISCEQKGGHHFFKKYKDIGENAFRFLVRAEHRRVPDGIIYLQHFECILRAGIALRVDAKSS